MSTVRRWIRDAPRDGGYIAVGGVRFLTDAVVNGFATGLSPDVVAAALTDPDAAVREAPAEQAGYRRRLVVVAGRRPVTITYQPGTPPTVVHVRRQARSAVAGGVR